MDWSLWEQLDSCWTGSANGTNIERYSNHEFIDCCTPNKNDLRLASVKKYDTITKTWSILFEYQFDVEYSHITAICIDHDNQRIFATSASRKPIIVIFDIKTKTMQKHPAISNLGNAPLLIMLNSELHIIGGHLNNKHYIWDDENSKMIQKYEFPGNHRGFTGHRLIHRKSDNTLIIFGGYGGGRLDSIWKYCINKNKWVKLDTKTPVKINAFGCIMTTIDLQITAI